MVRIQEHDYLQVGRKEKTGERYSNASIANSPSEVPRAGERHRLIGVLRNCSRLRLAIGAVCRCMAPCTIA